MLLLLVKTALFSFTLFLNPCLFNWRMCARQRCRSKHLHDWNEQHFQHHKQVNSSFPLWRRFALGFYFDHFSLSSFHLYLGTIARQPTRVWSNRTWLIRPDLINVCNWACLVIGTNKHLGCSWLLAPALTTPRPPRGEASLCRGLLCQARLKGVHKTAVDFMTHNLQYFIRRQGPGSEFSESLQVLKKHNTPFMYLIVVLSRGFVLLSCLLLAVSLFLLPRFCHWLWNVTRCQNFVSINCILASRM